MFEDSSVFNQDISNWDTSNVTDMTQMFKNASKFNQQIKFQEVSNNSNTYYAWNTLEVTKMNQMFKDANDFAGDMVVIGLFVMLMMLITLQMIFTKHQIII